MLEMFYIQIKTGYYIFTVSDLTSCARRTKHGSAHSTNYWRESVTLANMNWTLFLV